MNIIELLSWISVELQSPKPNLEALRTAVDQALLTAASLDLRVSVSKDQLIRMAQMAGLS